MVKLSLKNCVLIWKLVITHSICSFTIQFFSIPIIMSEEQSNKHSQHMVICYATQCANNDVRRYVPDRYPSVPSSTTGKISRDPYCGIFLQNVDISKIGTYIAL